MDWVRLFHDMPTDPKWRVIAKKAGQRIGDVIAVFTFVLTNASSNTVKRGETHGLVAEDIAAAIDLDEAGVTAILGAMEGKVVKNGQLLAWEKRNSFLGDSSTERVRKHRETQRNAMKPPETEQIQNKTEQKEDTSLRSVPAKRKMRHGLPDGFPTEADLDWSRDYWLGKGRSDLCGFVSEEVEKFRDHHSGKLTASADWPGSWRTWARNAMKFGNGGRNNGKQPTPHEKFAIGAFAAAAGDELDAA